MKPGEMYQVDYGLTTLKRHPSVLDRLYTNSFNGKVKLSCLSSRSESGSASYLKQNDVVLVISFSVTKSDSRLFEAFVLHHRTKLIGFVRLWESELPGETWCFLKKVAP